MTQIAWNILPLTLLAGLLITSCAPQTMWDPAGFKARKAEAMRLTRQGNLAEALDQWKVLEAIDPSAPEIARMRRSTEDEMGRRAESHYRRAEAARSKRRMKEARREYVRTLAFAPSHKGALRQLRNMELARTRKDRPKANTFEPYRLSEPETENDGPAKRTEVSGRSSGQSSEDPATRAGKPGPAAQVASREKHSLDTAITLAGTGAYADSIPHFKKHLASHPDDAEAQDRLALSHRQVGLNLYRDGKLRDCIPHLQASLDYGKNPYPAVRKALADAKSRLTEQTYENGLRAFRTDVSQAILFWEETLSYDPSHLKAKSSLSKAIRIRDNLKSAAEP